MTNDEFTVLNSADILALAVDQGIDPDLPFHRVITRLRAALGLPAFSQRRHPLPVQMELFG